MPKKEKRDNTPAIAAALGGGAGLGLGAAQVRKKEKELAHRFQKTPKGKLKARHVLPHPGYPVQLGRLMREAGITKGTGMGALEGLFLPGLSSEKLISAVTKGRRGVPSKGLGADLLSNILFAGTGVNVSPARIAHQQVRRAQVLKMLGEKSPKTRAIVSGVVPSPLDISSLRRGFARKTMKAERLRHLGRLGLPAAVAAALAGTVTSVAKKKKSKEE